MSNDTYDAILADWSICELPGNRVFLVGKVTGDRERRSRDGTYITTSVVIRPIDAIADGHVVKTMNSRYLLTDRNTVDDALFARLDTWLDAQLTPVELGDVLAARDLELFAAYVLRAFREAAATAAWFRAEP